jgi:hypothetical protein
MSRRLRQILGKLMRLLGSKPFTRGINIFLGTVILLVSLGLPSHLVVPRGGEVC